MAHVAATEVVPGLGADGQLAAAAAAGLLADQRPDCRVLRRTILVARSAPPIIATSRPARTSQLRPAAPPCAAARPPISTSPRPPIFFIRSVIAASYAGACRGAASPPIRPR